MSATHEHGLANIADLTIMPLQEKELGELAHYIGPVEGLTNYYPRWRAHRAGMVDVLLARQEHIVGHVEMNWAPYTNSAFADTGIPEICNLLVVAERRNHGIGRALVMAAESLATARGFRHVGLSVSPHRALAAAQHLYTSLGYESFPLVASAEGPWLHELRYLTKTLPSGDLALPRELTLSHLLPNDPRRLANAFAVMGKPPEQFAAYRDEIYRHERLMLIARHANDVNAIVGYTTLRWEPWYEGFRDQGLPEIVDLNIVPAFRRQGIGAALIGACEHTVATRGLLCLGISVEQTPEYAGAERLYRRLGYVPDGRGVTPVDNELHLIKELDPRW